MGGYGQAQIYWEDQSKGTKEDFFGEVYLSHMECLLVPNLNYSHFGLFFSTKSSNPVG